MKSLLKFVQIYRSIKQKATIFSGLIVILLFGLFLEAYMHDFNLVYITLFFVFSLAFSAGPIGVLNIGNLKASFIKSPRLFAKDEGTVFINIENSSNISSWAIKVYAEDGNFASLDTIRAESVKSIPLLFTPSKRGGFIYKNCYLESSYPLSTAILVMKIDESYEGVAYPQPKGISLRSFINQELNPYGEEVEFDGLQKYDGSQRVSTIHWASVAKGELSVKTFTKESQTPNLVFDFYKSADNDEDRLSQLCLWVLECEKQNLIFSIKMPKKILSFPKETIDETLIYLAKY